MRIFITGSAGLVGTAVAASLAAQGHEVVGYDIASSAAGGPAEDIGDLASMRAGMRGCDGVIHLAAVSRVLWGERNPELCRWVNVSGTQRVIDAAFAQPVPPWLILASSREIYGNPPVSPVTEDAPADPVNHYGRSKAEAERLVGIARKSGLRTHVLRLSNVYGSAFDHPDRAVPALLWSAMSGHELRVTGAQTFFDFVHVDDCAEGFLRVADMLQAGDGGLPPIHLTTGIPTNLAELAEKARDIAASRSRLIILPPRDFDVAGFCGVPDRAAALLGWRAKIGLDEGLARLHEILAARGRAPDPVDMRLVPIGAG